MNTRSSMQKNPSVKYLRSLVMLLFLSFSGLSHSFGQSTNGCVGGNFGIDAGLYSNILEFGNEGTPAAGTTDWFFSQGTGAGIIDESNLSALQALLQGGGNPTYETRMGSGFGSIVNGQLMIDALWARDQFGGTGFVDPTSFNTASKNGEDPAIWDPGPQNVLGKNDLIDFGVHMFRNGTSLTSDLWFVGLIDRAEPNGDAYMDFEFFIEKVHYNPGSGFSSGGPQLGHTAFTFDNAGNITKLGDILFNVSLYNGGTNPNIEIRIWVSYADYTTKTPANFTWGPNYDGAYTGSPYGYASIVPNATMCGKVNLLDQKPLAPPWGTKNTKYNSWETSYNDFAVAEVGVNLTSLGLDFASIQGADPCIFPIMSTIVKTRSSNSFTAQLKDFAGPFHWGQSEIVPVFVGNQSISCINPLVTLSVDPVRNDCSYSWTTVDGQIESNPNLPTITVSQPGTYTVHSTLPTGCTNPDASITVGFDATHPFFNDLTATSTVSCSGSDGSIDLTVSGGTPPYTYLWSPGGSTVQDPLGLAPGTYSVTVTDNLGCIKTLAGVVVGARTPGNITFIPTQASCYGSGNGSIDATVTGKSPFTYLWSTGATTEDVVGLSAGTYSLTATDADGCTQSASIAITQPEIIILSLTKTNDSDPGPSGNGTIDLTVSGGTPGYTYAWTRNGNPTVISTQQDPTGLTAGTYTVVVTDSKGCTATISAEIYEPEICNDGIDNDGNGLADCFDSQCVPANPGTITPGKNPVCVGDAGVTYTVANTAGFTYNWTVPAGADITAGEGTNEITVTWMSNTGGQVCVKAVSGAGCTSSGQSCFTVTLNDMPMQPGSIIKGP